jgi:hypothetical protein
MSDNRGGPSARDRGRNDVFRLVEGAAPAGPPPAQHRLPDASERLVEATTWRCLELIRDAVEADPAPLLAAICIGHSVYTIVLALAAEQCRPDVRERLAQDAAAAIARAVREAAPW